MTSSSCTYSHQCNENAVSQPGNHPVSGATRRFDRSYFFVHHHHHHFWEKHWINSVYFLFFACPFVVAGTAFCPFVLMITFYFQWLVRVIALIRFLKTCAAYVYILQSARKNSVFFCYLGSTLQLAIICCVLWDPWQMLCRIINILKLCLRLSS